MRHKPKIKIQSEVGSKVAERLQFDIRDVQKRNPRTENKTPFYLFCPGPDKKLFKQKDWWEK